MSLEAKVLGKPGNDNSVFIKLDSGQRIIRFLLDTGANCLWQLPRSELSQVDHILFSHYHMDHVCGFDSIFRLIYNKPEPVHIWGPHDTLKVIQSRARGYSWNLVDKSRCKILIHEIHKNKHTTAEIKLIEGFEKLHILSEENWSPPLLFKEKDFSILGNVMDHKIDCMAYGIKESDKENIDTSKIFALGLKPGKWCQDIKKLKTGVIRIDDKDYQIEEIRKNLISASKGQLIGYVTDTIYNDEMHKLLIGFLKDADNVIMECAYLEEEKDLALRHHHMTVSQVSTFAKLAGLKKLTLFHISDRYPPEIRNQFLDQAREIFPETYYPYHWKINGSQFSE